MRKTIVTVFTIGSIAISTVTVTAAAAATNAVETSTTIIQRQLNRTERQQARLNEFAQILGITTDELQTEFKSGKQPLQIAQEYGLSKDQLKQKMDNYHQKTLRNIKQQLGDRTPAEKLYPDRIDAKLKRLAIHNNKNQGWHRRHFGF